MWVMESRTEASRPRPQPRTSLTRQRGTRLKSNSRAFTLQNIQWLVNSVSSSFSKDLSHEAKDSTLRAKAKTKDFKIVFEDPRGRGLVLEDSDTDVNYSRLSRKSASTSKNDDVLGLQSNLIKNMNLQNVRGTFLYCGDTMNAARMFCSWKWRLNEHHARSLTTFNISDES